MSSYDKHMVDDRVFYNGSNFAQELANKVGWVVSKVQNQENSYVVWFENMKKDDTYILHTSNMVKIRPAKTDQSGVEIRPRRQSIEQLTEE